MSNIKSIIELSEMKVHIDELIAQIGLESDLSGRDRVLQYNFAHIQNHLNLAWHYLRYSEADAKLISADEYEQLAGRIPNYTGEFTLEEP